jgi:hypothetical protein
MSDMYLVTLSGERHEDHIPFGVFTFDALLARGMTHCDETPLKSDDFRSNKWVRVTCPSEEENYFVIQISINEEMPWT